MSTGLLLLGILQVVFAGIVGLYFFNMLRMQKNSRSAIDKESTRELERLRRMRSISLAVPLSEKTRPTHLGDIVGQADGLRALRAALCGPHPQHVLIYGPPGVGKTAAARVVLEEAKRSAGSPFLTDAVFFEVDATTARFDERGIADPLIGSVHDPIYQGAGAMGMAGIPQPKPGAVTKAHGGILFIDEIGELHPIQLNKLLKILEDRKVLLESAYYSADDTNLPPHIHDIFQNGLPADFRLVGATTREPEEIPPAIRSRCLEIYFRPLTAQEIGVIVHRAAAKIECGIADDALDVAIKHLINGREAVNLVQLAAGVAQAERRKEIRRCDVEWVVQSSRMTPRPDKHVADEPQVGVVNGLAVYGPSSGLLLEVEAFATPAQHRGRGKMMITGVVEEEQLGGGVRVLRRKSMARASLDNVVTALRRCAGLPLGDYDIHVNFPGGVPVDGPSAGVSMAVAIYSAVTGIPVNNLVAMTGELSIQGHVRPVGGVFAKVEAAVDAGAKTVLIPAGNYQERLADVEGILVLPVNTLAELLAHALTDTVQLPTVSATAGAGIASGVTPAAQGTVHGA